MSVKTHQDTSPIEVWSIASDVARANVFSVGGALHDLTFSLPNGATHSPLAESDWIKKRLRGDSGLSPGYPKHVELLGGEWPCVPFGTTSWDDAHHGFSADNTWNILRRSDNQIELSLTYPVHHVVERVERRITLPFGQTCAEIELVIFPRKTAIVPIGLHPILRLPERENAYELAPSTYECATIAPASSGRKGSVFTAGTTHQSLEQARLANGQKVDVLHNTHLLKDELIQLWNTDGRFRFDNLLDRVSTHLFWDKTAFPHCLLWICGDGANFPSQDRLFKGIGIEPVSSFFDRNDTLDPIEGWPNGATRRTGTQLFEGYQWSTRYRISCHSMSEIN